MLRVLKFGQFKVRALWFGMIVSYLWSIATVRTATVAVVTTEAFPQKNRRTSLLLLRIVLLTPSYFTITAQTDFRLYAVRVFICLFDHPLPVNRR